MKKRDDKHTLAEIPTPTSNRFVCLQFTWTQTSVWQKSDFMAINRCPSTPYFCNTLKNLSRGTRSYAFFRSTKHFFSKTCFRVKTWFVMLRPGQKPYWPSYNFDSTISRHILPMYLAYTIPGRLRSDNFW